MTTTTKNSVLRIPQATLKSGISAVLHAADDYDSRRFALAGVRVVIDPGQVTFIATDGRRLAWKRFEFDHGLDRFEFTIPRKQARELADMYGQRNYASVCIHGIITVERVCVHWRNGNRKDKRTEFTPNDGRFPDVMPYLGLPSDKAPIGWIESPADALASYFAEDRGIDLRANGSVEVLQNPRRVEARKGRKSLVNHSGEFEIRLDRSFVADALKACGKDAKATLYAFDNGDSPVYLESDCGLHAVIMPLRRDQ